MEKDARFTPVAGGQFIITDPQATQAPIIRRLAEGRCFLVNAHDLEPEAEIHIPDVTKKLRSLRTTINAQFIGRYDLVDMVTLALAGGDHAFVQGPPGTGKSRILRLFAEGLGGKFFSINLAKDVTREMMVGPVSMAALRTDVWDRSWNGLATAQVALIDEIWEANAAVTTIIKPILEERRVEEAGIARPAPLLSAFAASNFVPEDRRQAADWDRWLYRLPVNYLSSASEMTKLAFAGAGQVPIDQTLSPEEILVLNGYVDFESSNPNQDFVHSWVELWEEIRSEGHLVSDRRWKRLLRAATARSILEDDDQPQSKHLSVAQWMFWNDPNQFRDLAKLVRGLTDPLASEVLDIERLGEALKERASKLAELDWNERAKVGTAADKVQQMIEALEKKTGDDYADRLTPIRELAQRVEERIVKSWREDPDDDDDAIPS